MTAPESDIQVIEFTCGHCGHQRYFVREGLQEQQLYDLDSRPCDQCGRAGALIKLTSYAGTVPFKLEQLSD